MSAARSLTVRLVKSPIGFSLRQKRIVRSLGFTRLQQTRSLPDNPAVRGMVAAVCHLVSIVPDAGPARKEGEGA